MDPPRSCWNCACVAAAAACCWCCCCCCGHARQVLSQSSDTLHSLYHSILVLETSGRSESAPSKARLQLLQLLRLCRGLRRGRLQLLRLRLYEVRGVTTPCAFSFVWRISIRSENGGAEGRAALAKTRRGLRRRRRRLHRLLLELLSEGSTSVSHTTLCIRRDRAALGQRASARGRARPALKYSIIVQECTVQAGIEVRRTGSNSCLF